MQSITHYLKNFVAKRVSGAINFRGIGYQLLYASCRLLEMGVENTWIDSIRLEDQDKANGTRPSLEFLAYEPFEKFIDKNFENDLDQLAELVDHCLRLPVDQTGNGQNDIRREYYHLRTLPAV